MESNNEIQVIFAQTAKVIGRNDVPYLKFCYSFQTEDEILKEASDLYEIEMVAIEARINDYPVYWSKKRQKFVDFPEEICGLPRGKERE